MKNIEKIKPSGIFTNYIYKAIPLAFDESMSYYETLCGVLNLLKDQEIIVNNNTDALKELQDYVTHYFDNLDVQEEINNKLDQMAESGQLTDIIAQYLQLAGILGYNTVNDMKNATNLVNGSFARTYGLNTYNDGKGAFYKIRPLTSSDVIDGVNIIAVNFSDTLIAEKMPDFNIEKLNDDINEINNKLNKKEDYYIILGDSYGTGYGNVTNFIDIFKENMNLDNEHLFSSAMNGIGFVNRPEGNKIFIELLQDLLNTMTVKQKQNITKIVVETGINDNNYTTNQIVNKIKEFYDYVKINLPKTTMYIYGVGRSANPFNNQNIINNVYPAFEEVKKYGIINIINSCDVMHNYSLFQNDGFHPTNDGSNKIAQFLEQGLKTGIVNPYYLQREKFNNLITQSSSISSLPDMTIRTEINNGYVKISCENGGFIGLNNINITGASEIIIGTITNYNDNSCCHPIGTTILIPITGYIAGYLNETYKNNIPLFGTLYFNLEENNTYTLHLRFSTYYNENKITNANGLQFDMFNDICQSILS